jgi:integrase
VSPGCFGDPDRDAVKQGSKDSARQPNQRDDRNRFRRTWGARKTKVINASKGNRERRVDVSQQLAEALTKHRDQQQIDGLLAGRELGPWVFPARIDSPYSPTSSGSPGRGF